MLRRIFDTIGIRKSTIGILVFFGCLLIASDTLQKQRVEDLRENAIIQCTRSNTLTAALNIRGGVTREFFLDAADTRRKQGKIAKRKGQMDEARINFAAEAKYRASARQYTKIPYLNCQKSVDANKSIYREP